MFFIHSSFLFPTYQRYLIRLNKKEWLPIFFLVQLIFNEIHISVVFKYYRALFCRCEKFIFLNHLQWAKIDCDMLLSEIIISMTWHAYLIFVCKTPLNLSSHWKIYIHDYTLGIRLSTLDKNIGIRISLRNVSHIKLISKISIAMLIIGMKFVSIPVILVSRW